MALTNDHFINIWQSVENRATETERARIIKLLDELAAHYAGSHHPGLTARNRASVLKALRLLKGRIQEK